MVFDPEARENEINFSKEKNRLPPLDTHVRDMIISKKGSAGEYVPRRIVTTEDRIYFCAVSGTHTVDHKG